MGDLDASLIQLLYDLVPGFIFMGVYRGLRFTVKENYIFYIVEAIIFTIIISSLFDLISSFRVFHFLLLQEFYFLKVIVAVFFGVCWAGVLNNGLPHSALSALKITRQTSFPSEWYANFFNRVTYVVLHLKGQRRLYGYPLEWPSDPQNGHFVMSNAKWLIDTNSTNNEVELASVDVIMIDTREVEMVEFLNMELSNG